MKKMLLAVVLLSTAAVAEAPRLKTMAEVYVAPDKATAVELNLATMDLMATVVRLAATSGDRDNMRKALIHLRDTASLMLKDLEAPAPAKAP